MNETHHGSASVMSDPMMERVEIILRERRPVKPFTVLSLSVEDYLDLRVAILKHKL